jgi:outer membrane protein insertion porin family
MRKYYWAALLLVLSACGTLRKLPEGEQLYRATEIVLHSSEPIENRSALQAELANVVHPKPNGRLFWQYPGIYIHERAKAEKGARLSKRLNKRYGEAPVYLSQLNNEKIAQLMQNRLENRGYFDHEIRLVKQGKGRKGILRAEIQLDPPYRLHQYAWYGPQDSLARLLLPQLPKGKLHPGTRYDLDALRTERERLDTWLKNRGYYAFSADYFIFRADTNLNNRQYNLYLGIKAASPPEALLPYRLGKVTVFPNYQVQTDSGISRPDTVVERGIQFIEGVDKTFLPHHLQRYIMLQPGQLYARERELMTSNRISNLGNFRFVTLRFYPTDSIVGTDHAVQTLQANLYLSPANKRRLRYETQFLSKSNNFVGPALKAGYQNRNLFKGGELLNIDMNLGFETQFAGGRQTGLNSYEAGIRSELVFPRVLAPVSLGENVSHGIARTRMVVGGSLLNRMQFYQLRAFQTSFGYTWNTNRFVTHDLQPFSVSFTGLARTSDAFEIILANNPFLQQSFDQRFIAGMVYQFTFSELTESKPHRWVAIASLDMSGNLLGALSGSGRLFGEPLAQYVRIDADLRHHWVLSKERRLVLRAFAGGGYSYGNSQTLPYIKQYFSGGPNSVRAFNIRSLGPGNYRPLDFDVASFFDQAGDIKLEANVEYRFPLLPYLKGAWFLDAGNIWLQRFNPALGGGQFTANWMQELGVGAGFGLRIDADILVFRFDLASPLRKPWLPAGSRWLGDFEPGSRNWRRENLNLVFAIGYPF